MRGIKPKDHRKENQKAIKAIYEERKKKEEESVAPEPEPFKMKKFQNVESKIMKQVLLHFW